MDLSPYLNDLEHRIHPEDEDALARDWLRFADRKWEGDVFAPTRTPRPAGLDWPAVAINDAIEDETLMVYSQLRMCSDMLADGTGELLCVRPNYGTGIIPSMFGAEVFMMPREHDILPGSRPLAGGGDEVLAAVERGAMDFSRGLAGRAFAFGERFRAATAGYPAVTRHVHMYDPDLQGPLPLVEAVGVGRVCGIL